MIPTRSIPARCFILIFVLGGLLSTNAYAWDRSADQLICLNAAKLMPAHFRDLLMKRKAILYRGLNASEHRARVTRLETIYDRINLIQQKLKSKVDFDAVVYEYGALAKLLSDLNDPTSLPQDHVHFKEDFDNLVASKIARIPTVFYGYDKTLLKDKKLTAYLEAISVRRQQQHQKLLASYVSGGRTAFLQSDDRSPIFGIAALSYSHAVSDVANIWLYLWQESHGDMSRTPFYKGAGVQGPGARRKPESQGRF